MLQRFLCILSIGLLSTPLFAANDPKEPTDFTIKMNDAVINQLPFSDKEDFTKATRGFIGTDKNLTIKDPKDGHVIWDLTSYQFIQGEKSPASINPSLWRHASLNMNNGLYKVTDRIYQVRGYDHSNMDIIEGDTGLIIVDPLISQETAKAALDLYYQHRPKKPVVAVIYTHSHVDHFGGVKGVINEADVKSGKVKVFAPKGFLEAAISENIYAGNAMTRRAFYQYGPALPRNAKGQLDTGLGKTTSLGNVTLIAPTDEISRDGETKTIDGIKIVFQMAPNTEAPAEFLMYFPQFKALCTSEDAVQNLHNLYTLRGAQIRDASAWWKTLNETVERFGSKTEVIFAQHQWPTWGNKQAVSFLESQRDLYKYIHDQTLRLMNQGYTMTEIGNMLELPNGLGNKWFNRGYYGSVSHNAKAVYQRYLGWYDSNPAHLNPMMPTESGRKYIEYMGGADAVLKKAKEAYDKGEYRWVAEVVNHIVVSDPDNQAARNLEADALEQLGYQQENPTWRNEYLMGAYELRNGVVQVTKSVTSPDVIHAMPLDMYLDYLAMRLDGQKADGKNISLNLNLTDTHQQYLLKLENSVLVYTANKKMPNADVSMSLSRNTLDSINLGAITLDNAIKNGSVKITGSRDKLNEFFGLFVKFNPSFNIMTSNL